MMSNSMTDAAPAPYSLDWLRAVVRPTITPTEAAAVLGLTAKTVIAMIDAGEVDGFRLGRKYHVRVAPLLGLLDTPEE
jgi:excisionase family DNA binding protein